MADFLSVQMTAIAAATIQYPIDIYGKMRISYFSYVAVGASTTPNTYDLFKLPPGRVRVLPPLCRLTHDAWGAARVLDLGNRAYTGEQNAAVAEVDNEYANNIDISSAGAAVAWATLLKVDLFSMTGITVFGTVSGGDQAASDALSGFGVYVTE